MHNNDLTALQLYKRNNTIECHNLRSKVSRPPHPPDGSGGRSSLKGARGDGPRCGRSYC